VGSVPEAAAPLGVIDNRFPALFEARRLFWPCYETLSDPARYEQGIDGFLEHIFLDDFRGFTEVAQTWTGTPYEYFIAARRPVKCGSRRSGFRKATR
jgi:hypothetical protein